MKNRYVSTYRPHNDTWEVIDLYSGQVMRTTNSEGSAKSYADGLNETESTRLQQVPPLMALVTRKLILTPVCLSVTYFLIGLFGYWYGGYPEFPWLALSAGGLLVLSILWGMISIIFSAVASLEDSHGKSE